MGKRGKAPAGGPFTPTRDNVGMQNAKCKMQKGTVAVTFFLHFAFCILHFVFQISRRPSSAFDIVT